MSEVKSKIISFRLPAEIESLARKAAIAAGDKNASAWCQKLVTNALAEIGEANQTGGADRHSTPICRDDLFIVSSSVRQFVFDCFKLLLKDGEDYQKLLKIAIKSEEESELISKNVSEPAVRESTRSNEFYTLEDKSGKLESAQKEDPIEKQFTAEKVSNEFMTFVAEIENEIAEIVAGEPVLAANQKNQTIQSAEQTTQRQMPNRLPFFDLADQ